MLFASMMDVRGCGGWSLRSKQGRRQLLPHVVDNVAMEHPIAHTFRHPSHIEGMVAIDKFSHHLAALCRTEKMLSLAIAYGVYIKIKTVQVHGMTEGRGVDDPPMLRFSDRRVQTLGVRPGFAIQGKGGMEVLMVEIFGPHLDDKNPVVGGSAGSIHDESA